MRSFFFLLFAASLSAVAQQTNILVEAGIHHIGEKEIKGFPAASKKPSAPKLEAEFQSLSNTAEWTLQLKQQNVLDDWGIEINGTRIGRLNIQSSERVSHFSVPPNLIVDGTNKLVIAPSRRGDDILVGQVELIPKRLRDVLKLGRVRVNVLNAVRREEMPVRITVANAQNRFADLYNITPNTAAWRKGIIYNGPGPIEFELPEGDWILTATRGMEWSRPRVNLRVFYGQPTRMDLSIAHEVDTAGYISVDTHLHTYTFSGHGDASLDERIWTLAGEGVEMAIATDHNHFTDYKPRQGALGASQYFTSVIGNEVTSANGHFNGFPFALDAEKPNHKETNWVKLVADIRSKGAQYVILNHPRWPAITNSPFSIWGLDRTTGARTNTMEFPMDAMEVVNSGVPLKEADYLLRDWFALLNRGERISGVGASDTHTVADPPGQGRTYVPSGTDDPAAIDVDAIIKQMRAGNMSISYGIFGHALVNETAKMGEITRPSNGVVNVKFHIGCPSWIKAQKAVVYLNGIKVAQQDLIMRPGAALNTNLVFTIPAPANDAFLVCAAYGDGIKDASWKTLQDYTLAVTNPVYVDSDGDGKYSPARETALRMLEKMGTPSLAKIESAVAEVDAAVGVQLMAEARLRLSGSQLGDWEKLLEKLALKHDMFLFHQKPSAMNPDRD